ncbi:multidrug resistance protein [Arthroderma uncinatum]|uniref:multidrug resistance protein n=1 Tax=Arthroderma uncinatum TaxID=74035 RepID=UPI00144AA41F|nr:multidrug resistance protein [Arthroderma uncinatum]KAF3483014.1 multidrug resistance protein [Arthroderma uncinatum]
MAPAGVDEPKLGSPSPQHNGEEENSSSGASNAADMATPNKQSDGVVDVPNAELKKDEPPQGFGAYVKLWSWCEPVDVVLRIVGFFAAIGAGTALPLMTIVFGKFVDVFNDFGVGRVSAADFRSQVSKNALWFVYLFIGKFCLVYIHTVCFNITSIRCVRKLRLEYVRSILSQEMAYFDTYTPGSVATRISNNANLIQAGMAEKVGTCVQGLAMLVAAFVVAFTQNWRLTLPVATTVPTAVTLVGITVVLDAKLEAKILDIYSKAGGLVEETLGSIRVVVAFGAGDRLRKKYDHHLEAAKAFGVKKGPILGVQYSSEFFIMYCAYALAFWYGIKLLLQGKIGTGGDILTVLFSIILGTSSLTMIAPTIGEFTKAGAAANDVLNMIERKPEIDSMSTEGQKPDGVNGDLEISDVRFSYPARPTVQVLNGVTLKIPARKVTALVGASGSGKSTIVGLIERWYDPASGSITLDGVELKDLNVKWLRSQVGLVQQEPVLFNDTIYTNVLYGLPPDEIAKLDEEKRRELVRQACIESNADTFIQGFPKGYDTVVGERGSLLSGGQRQRVAIARSIISNPPILLLDEATSALDPTAEAIVQAALDRVSKTRTTILIAHKLSTVKKADNIVVMNKGQVLEQGTHDSLLDAKGQYWNLVNAQSLSLSNDDATSASESEKEADEPTEALEKQVTTKSIRSNIPNEVIPQTEDVSRKVSLFRCIVKILYEQRRHWVFFLCGGIASVAGGGAFPAQAILFSKIVTIFQLPEDQLQGRGNFWALMFFILALCILVTYASIGFFLTVAAFRSSKFYRSEYFRAMISQDIEFFDQPDNSSGSLTARLSTDPQNLQDLLSSNIGLILIVMVSLLSVIILALATGWKLALVSLFGCLPPLFLAGFTRMRMEMQAQDKNAKLYLESARFAAEAVNSIRTVSSLTLESTVYNNYGDRLKGPVARSVKHTIISMIFFGLSDSIDTAAMALGFWYGGRLISYGEYTAEQFFVVFIAIIFGGQSAGIIFGFTLNTTKAHAAANQILHLRNQVAPINGSTGETPASGEDSDVAVEFRNVTFSYPTRPDQPVLRKINLKILRGQNIGLVGPSGCGKTTMIALLERFYDITSGDILINGKHLTEIDVTKYRETASLVSQETTLYQGTIRENILLGVTRDVPDEEIFQACKNANIHDFIISLPEGYNTEAGSRGLSFSGGQRQRLATARALLRNPDFLFLDEATSALDTESERVVQAALEHAKKGRTTIAVAHRLSTVQDCDAIFVLEAGKIVERGTHQDLLRMKGRYFEMCKAQSLDREA